MNLTPAHPAELTATLAHMGLSDLLEGYIAPERVRRWGVLAVERFASTHGYQFVRRDGNLYSALMLVPVVAAPVPQLQLRIVTRSDVAAVHGSRRRAA
jgi:hypothetical protein